MHRAPYDEASHITAEDGEVIIEGPGGVAVSMTPDAAEETGRRLIDGAEQARRQLAN